MHWVEVDGYPMPKLISGHAGLNLCNTWAGWGKPWDPHREWIPDYDRLAVWARHAGLIAAGEASRLRHVAARSPGPAERVVIRVHRFRADLYAVALEQGDRRRFRRVASAIEEAVSHSRFDMGDNGVAGWRFAKSAGLELPLYAAARAAESLLSAPSRHQVARCPGDDCGWLFVNARGRRKWCDMANCGNRAKARAYSARHA